MFATKATAKSVPIPITNILNVILNPKPGKKKVAANNTSGYVQFLLPLMRNRYNELKVLFPFFDGLIPEGWLLGIVSRNWKLDRNDRFGLLLSVCKDCIGDVRIQNEVTM